jgi:hypothetical protein
VFLVRIARQRRRGGVFGSMLAGSSGDGGMGDMVAIGMRGKVGGVGRRQVAARGRSSE